MGKILNLEYENPKTRVKSSGRIEIKNQTAGSADLYFYGDICSSQWEKWDDTDKCPQDVADFLNALDGVEELNIYINSGGGDSFAGNAIYNILTRNTAKKTVYIEGLAASAASVIAMAGETIVMPPGAQIMIHNAWTIAMGNANDFRKMAETLDKVSASHIEIYMKNAVENMTEAQFKEMMDSEKWMNGEEAKDIFKAVTIEGEQIAASLDCMFMNRYKNIPKSLVKNEEPPAEPPVGDDGRPEPKPEPKPEPPDDGKEKAMAKARATLALSK